MDNTWAIQEPELLCPSTASHKFIFMEQKPQGVPLVTMHDKPLLSDHVWILFLQGLRVVQLEQAAKPLPASQLPTAPSTMYPRFLDGGMRLNLLASHHASE